MTVGTAFLIGIVITGILWVVVGLFEYYKLPKQK